MENKNNQLYILVFFLLPFLVVFIPDLGLYDIEINKFIYLVTTLVLILLLTLKNQTQFRKLIITKQTIFVFLIIGCFFTSNIVNKHVNIKYLWQVACLLFFYIFYCFWHIASKELKIKFVMFVIGIGQISVLMCYAQLLGIIKTGNSFFKITGPFSNPGPCAIYLGSLFSFAAGMLIFNVYSQARYQKIILYTYVFSALPVLIVLASRTATISVIVVFFYFLFFKSSESSSKNFYLKRFFHLSILLIVLTIALITSFSFKQGSTHGRQFIYKICGREATAVPLYGYGANSFVDKFGKYQQRYFNDNLHLSCNNSSKIQREAFLADKCIFSFNDYIQYFFEYGIFGLLLLAFLLLLPAIFLIKKQKLGNDGITIPAAGSLLMIMCSAFSSYPLEILPIFFMIMMFAAICSVSFANSNNNSGYLKGLTLSILIMVIIFTSAYTVYYAIKLGNLYSKGERSFTDNNYGNAISYFRRAEEIYPMPPEYILEYGKALMAIGKFKEALPILLEATNQYADEFLYLNIAECYGKLNENKLSEKYLKMAVFIVPNRLFPRYLLARHYAERADSNNAKQISEGIMCFPVKVNNEATQEIRYYTKNLLDSLRK